MFTIEDTTSPSFAAKLKSSLAATAIGFSIAAVGVTAIGAFVATATPAAAEQIAPLKVRGWKGGAYTNNQTGNFSHCAAQARYRSGITLLFSVTRERKWSMGFSGPNWKLAPGSEYEVAFKVDNGPILKGIARAKTDRLAQVHLPTNNRLFKAFRYGSRLRVAAAKQVFNFNLTGTSHMLATLLKCVKHYNSIANSSSNPFGNKASNPFGNEDPYSSGSGWQNTSATPQADTGVTPQRRTEGRTVAKLLLTQAGLKHEFMTRDDQPTLWKRNEVTWRMPGMFGTLRIVPGRNVDDVDIRREITANDARSCTGKYASGDSGSVHRSITSFVTACITGEEGDLGLYYAIMPRKGGGHYMVSVIGPVTSMGTIEAAGKHLAETAAKALGGKSSGNSVSYSY